MDSRPGANEAEDKENVVNINPIIIAQAEDSSQEENMAESASAIVPDARVLEIFQFHYHLLWILQCQQKLHQMKNILIKNNFQKLG